MKRKTPMARKVAPPKGKSNVSPQDQAMYDRTMIAARRVLYGDANDDRRFKIVLQRLQGSKGDQLPVAIGQMTAVVLSNIEGAAQQQGKQIPGYILFHAGKEIIADLEDIAVAAKLMDEAKRQEIAELAVVEAMKAYKLAQRTAGAQPTPAQPTAAPQPTPQPGIINAARGA